MHHSRKPTPTLLANVACSVFLGEYPSKPSIEPLHLVFKQIKMILFYPQSFVTWSIPCHYDSHELWPPLNGIIPHVHYRGMCRLLGIILPVYSVTTSVCVITAKASVAAELLQKESTSYITPINSCFYLP